MSKNFDAEKAVESILYIAKRVEEPTFHKISKILYFADQIHVVKYGSFILDDEYVAMRNGPVPSATYDILKYVRGDRSVCYAEHAKSVITVKHRFSVHVSRDADLNEFSESDIECLDQSIRDNGKLDFNQLTRKSHDAIYNSAQEDEFIPNEAFAELSDEPDSLKEHLADPTF